MKEALEHKQALPFAHTIARGRASERSKRRCSCEMVGRILFNDAAPVRQVNQDAPTEQHRIHPSPMQIKRDSASH